MVARLDALDAPVADRRAAWLAAVLLALEGAAGDVGGPARPWERDVVVDTRALAARAGLGPADCERGVQLLRDAGVLVVPDGDTLGDEAHRRFAADLWRPSPTADAVDWDTVLAALHGNAAAILSAVALADLLRRPDRFAAVPRAALQAHTLYGTGMIKRALATLVAAAVVERVPPNAYRFADLALGRAPQVVRPEPDPPSLGSPLSPERSAVTAAGVSPPAARHPLPAPLVQFVAAGIPLSLPKDTTVELETEIDGRRATLRLRFPSE